MLPGLVIFDCDGVLVDTERIQVRVESRVLTELGWPITAGEVVERWMGRASEFQLGEVSERLGPTAAREYDARSTAEAHAAFDNELTEVEGISALVDVVEAAGISTCVASSGSHARILRTLGITGLFDRFAGRIFSGTEVPHGKPAPDLFVVAAKAMDVPPERCVVIEDSLYGVRAGVTAGMRVIGYAGGLVAPDSLAAEGAEVVDQMAHVPALLGLSQR
ncbi:MAG: HAD family hydrolase [Nocardioides sp.]|nr:HAD family hydrolase [Nocardioides sp.]